jgi:hypothetical protein
MSVCRGGVWASRGCDEDCRCQVELLWQAAELSRKTGLLKLEEMCATAAPSHEELEIGMNGEVGYDLGWGWTLE